MRHIFILLTILLSAFFWPAQVHAQYSDNDLLIDKLVQKGYLSPIEAEILKDETKEYVGKHMNEGRMFTLPQWVQTIKLKGDLRIRNEVEKRKDFDEVTQRGKLRVRLGIIAKLKDQLSVGVGMTTNSGGDPRSSSIDLTDSFEKGDFRLDYGYAEWKPAPWFKTIAGKYPKIDYLWNPTDLLFDADLNPAGGSIHLENNLSLFNKKYGRQFTAFLNAGYWLIDDAASQTEDPAMTYVQPGLKFENEHFDTTLVSNLYYFHFLQGRELDYTACSNSGLFPGGFDDCAGLLDNEFRTIGGSLELGYRKQFHEIYKRAAIFGEFIRNTTAPSDINQGFAYGFKIGDLTVKKPWHWQLLYQYSRLEQDAFPDIFPSSNRYDGETGVEGHKASIKFGISENVFMGLTYHRHEQIVEGEEVPITLYQMDMNYIF